LGLELAITILWQVSRISADLSSSTARAALTISTMQSEGASPGAIFKSELLIWIFFGLSSASTFMVWPVYATAGTDLPLAEGLFAAHFIFNALIAGFNAYSSHKLARSINDALTESYEKLRDPRILSVRDDLVAGQRFERNISMLIGVSYLLLGAIPRLWTTHDYFWCTIWLLLPFMGLKALFRLESAQRAVRGDKERDKLIAALQSTAEETGGRPVSLSTTEIGQVFTSRWGWAFRPMSKRVSNTAT
jgi:hypothetical protein